MIADKAVDEVRSVLEAWAKATRQNRQDDILKNHAVKVEIFDVLPPLKYESAESYRRSWGEWHPDTAGEGEFHLQELNVTAGTDLAFAHCLIRCGGTTPEGRSFEDMVRATFCLERIGEGWKIVHQHISKPLK